MDEFELVNFVCDIFNCLTGHYTYLIPNFNIYFCSNGILQVIKNLVAMLNRYMLRMYIYLHCSLIVCRKAFRLHANQN